MARKSKSIYSAFAANVLIAITKFIAGSITNSTSMISEGIHSVVDTVNEIVLLYGLKRSKRPADKYRPFGYGKELYFWSFIVSILIFGLGGGLSIYQGIVHILHPHKLENPTMNYIVLGISFLFEGISLRIAAKEFNKVRGDQSWWQAIVSSKDPSSFLVLFEDGAAVIGLAIVFIFMLCSHAFDLPFLDGIATIIIGLLLILASLIIARESRSLLLGEGISAATQHQIKAMTEKDEAVVQVLNMISTYQAPEEVVLILFVVFKSHLETAELAEAIDRIEKKLKQEFKRIHYVIIQPDKP